MPDRTVDTGQGEVSYETVICSSCGDEVAKENAIRLIVGEIHRTKHYQHSGKYQYDFKDEKPALGWLCNFCHENPAAYPHKNDSKQSDSDGGRLFHLAKFIKG